MVRASSPADASRPSMYCDEMTKAAAAMNTVVSRG
jgi:hypothetical protein